MRYFLLIICITIFSFTAITKAQAIQEWAVTYNGSASNSNDVVVSIAVDVTGNIFVTGTSTENGSYKDITTIKYNSLGVLVWKSTYNGPANSSDEAYSLAIDGIGNIYITGESQSSGMTSDIVTIKYNSTGNIQWVARFNKPNSTWNSGISIAVDGTGNVYVAGNSYNSTSKDDYLTIKYNASGILQWTASYNGPGNDYDVPRAMKTDNNGNVFVTGFSIATGTNDDFATIKYNTNGVEQWVKRYNGPGNGGDQASSIWLDNTGNIYVSGASLGIGTNFDFATLKYNTSGVQQWEARYNGPANSIDGAHVLKTDNSGNVYVTGSSTGINTDVDYATIKYNSLGNEQWVSRFDGNAIRNNDSPTDLVLDTYGNVFVTGASMGPSQVEFDINTIKYNNAGTQQWVAKFNGPANFSDIARTIGLDNNGNVIIAGSSYSNQTNNDFLVVKYTQGEYASFHRTSLNKSIVDLNSTFDTINVNIFDLQPQFRITDVNIVIDTALHPNTGDLEFMLIHGNITDTLVYHAGGTGDNFIETKLNDSSATLISNGTAPFTGSYKPYKPLSILNNGDATGNWILKVYDRASGNTGTLKAWTLQLKFSTVIGLEPLSNEIPKTFVLKQNYPNPFNPETKIKFDIPKASFVELKVYDVLGKEVSILVNENLSAGVYSVELSAANMPSGVYFYKLNAGSYIETKKMVLIK